MSRALATIAGAYVGRRVELSTRGTCAACGANIQQLDPPGGLWMTADDGGSYACRANRLHRLDPQSETVGTILRVTLAGFVVRLERSGRTIRGIRDDDIGRYLE